MYILALETTGKFGSAAIIDESGHCCDSRSLEQMNHLQDITTISSDCCTEMGITPSELTQVAASVGPGSFTGIRIGVTTARTLGQMLNIPCVAVSSLAAMARKGMHTLAEISAKSEQSNRIETFVCPIINARRHQTYAGLWRLKENTIHPELPEKQYMIEDLLIEIAKRGGTTYFIGDGIDAYESIIRDTLAESSFILAEESVRYQDARFVAELAREKVLEGEVLTYEQLLPNYMRKSEAEMRLEAGTLSKKIHG